MLRNIIQKIENNRNNQKKIWKILLWLKDLCWKTYDSSESFLFALFSLFNREKIFESIYRTDKWLGGSGRGSTPAATKEYREFLQNFLKKYDIKSILDAGCGDWQSSRFIDWGDREYTGIDIVSSVIDKNTENFASHNIKFYTQDLVNSSWPPADLLIIKDVLQHLSNKSISKILYKTRAYKYLLYINDDLGKGHKNTDCFDGGYRAIDLTLKPFQLGGKKIFTYLIPGGGQKSILFVENHIE